MVMDKKRIIFYGTPAFAVSSLDAMLEAGFNIVAVVTSPDRPAGRGLQVRESDVKKYAADKGITVLQPVKMTDMDFLEQLKELAPDIQVVVAFRKLPGEVFTLPPMGTINVHASLLPAYRGAAPINRAIMNGEKETGVTTFFINENIDHGHIIMQSELSIGPHETAGELHDRLKEAGASLLVETLKQIISGKVKSVAQNPSEVHINKKAPKIHKEDCRINWDLKGDDIINQIRGLSPYPGAFTELLSEGGKIYILKVYNAIFEKVETSQETLGMVHTDGKTYLKVVVKDGLVALSYIQLTGRVSMDINQFLRGFPMNQKFTVRSV